MLWLVVLFVIFFLNALGRGDKVPLPNVLTHNSLDTDSEAVLGTIKTNSKINNRNLTSKLCFCTFHIIIMPNLFNQECNNVERTFLRLKHKNFTP